MPVAGVDVGSVAAKAVIFDECSATILAHSIIPTGWNPRQAGEDALARACALAGIDRQALKRIVGTGYGRIALPFANKTVTEITCHALGAIHLFPETGVVLDIGGQDSKAITVDTSGVVQDFVMNDKCAAGTGRFLQVLSGILGMDVQKLDETASRGNPVEISSMCAVFAETEIVGLLAQGVSPEDVAAGVFRSLAKRMVMLSRRIACRGEYTFTGGLATLPAFVSRLASELGTEVNVAKKPQNIGALGAALIAARG